MFQIENLTDDARQAQSLVLPDGTIIEIAMYFCSMQQCWFLSQLIYKDFEINSIMITNQPDILYQFKNKIPFGLACFSASDREPSLQQDFLSGNSKLYILTQAEVTQYEDFLVAKR